MIDSFATETIAGRRVVRAALRVWAFLGLAWLSAGRLSGQDLQRWHLQEEGVYTSARAPLTRVRQITVDAVGAVYVLDAQSPGVLVFNRDGTYRGMLGRTGGGPGEFRSLSLGWMGWIGDSLWVIDPALRRASLFRSDGSFVRDEAVPEVLSSKTALYFAGRAVLPGECWLLIEAYYAGRSQTAVEALGQSLIRQCPGHRRPDTLAVLNVKNRWLVVTAPTSPPSEYQGFEPWTNADVWNVSDSGRQLALVRQPPATARGAASYRAEVLSTNDGARRWVINTRYRPIRLTHGIIERWMNSILDQGVGKLFSSNAAGRRAIGARLYEPRFVPPVRAVLVSRKGGVWIEREATPDSTAWDVLNPDGRLLARVEVPSDVTIDEVQDSAVWAVAVDTLGVASVVRYRIMR